MGIRIGIGRTIIGQGLVIPNWTPPKNIIITEIQGGNRITFTQTSSIAEVEIWCSINSGTNTLITILQPGVVTYDHLFSDDNVTTDYSLRNRIESGFPTYDASTISLINRMKYGGDDTTEVERGKLNTAIIALKAANLFDTQFDVFVPLRSLSRTLGKYNWIKDNHKALEVANGGTLTYTEKLGYNSDGSKSYIRTQYTPSTANGLLTLNDACFGFKVSGTIGASTSHGTIDSNGDGLDLFQAGYGGINNNYTANIISVGQITGYNCLTRSNSTTASLMRNAAKIDYTVNSTALCLNELFMLRMNFTTPFYCNTGQKLELYWAGKGLSQSQYLVLQSIMNAYFASL